MKGLFKRGSKSKDSTGSPTEDSGRKLSVKNIFGRKRDSVASVESLRESTESLPHSPTTETDTVSSTSTNELTRQDSSNNANNTPTTIEDGADFEPATLSVAVNSIQQAVSDSTEVEQQPATVVEPIEQQQPTETVENNNATSDNNNNNASNDTTVSTPTPVINTSEEPKKRKIIKKKKTPKAPKNSVWISNVIEFLANVEEGEIEDVLNASVVSKEWYIVASNDTFWKPLVVYLMDKIDVHQEPQSRTFRSKYLSLVNPNYEEPDVVSYDEEPEEEEEEEEEEVVEETPVEVTQPVTPSTPTEASSPTSTRSSKPVAPAEPVDPSPFYMKDWRTIEYQEEPEDNIEWALENNKNEIECATLGKLIEMLTHHKEYDNFFTQTFILTFRSFTDQMTLMDKLVERFCIPPTPTITHEEFGVWKKEKLDKVRLRVTSTLKYWMENFFLLDFLDTEIMKKMDEIIDVMEKTNAPAFANMLKKTIEKMNGDQTAGITKTEVKCPDLLKPKKSFFGKKKKYGVFDYPLLEIARQITLLDFDSFAKIEPKECLNQSWNKEYRVTKAPNINTMIQMFNKLSNWVGTEIVKREKLEDRVEIIEKVIELGNHCKELNNFNALFSVISGLNLASIFRLKQTWAAVSAEKKAQYDELNKYISRDFNFRAIRTALKNVKPPCIPYIGLYLTDLTFIEEGNPKYINNKINFARCRRFAEVIRDMQTYQNTRYALLPFPELQELILGIEILTEEEMYAQSLKVEARETKKKKKPAA